MSSTINQDAILSGKVSTQDVLLSGKVSTQDVLLSGKVATLGVADISLSITGATVGQIAKITAVDGTGKPTAWEAVDMPSCLNSTASTLLITILRNALYKTDQSSNITALEAAIDAPRDNITFVNGVLTILALANDPVQSGAALTIS